MKKLFILVSLVALCATAWACSGPDEVADATPVPTVLPTTDKGRCPIKVPETTASVADAGNDVAVTYVTGNGDVTELRRRVNILKDELNKMAAAAETASTNTVPADGSSGKMAGTPTTGADGTTGKMADPNAPVRSTATVAEVDQGATITLSPAPGTSVAKLKSHVDQRAAAMKNGECMEPSLDSP